MYHTLSDDPDTLNHAFMGVSVTLSHHQLSNKLHSWTTHITYYMSKLRDAISSYRITLDRYILGDLVTIEHTIFWRHVFFLFSNE